MRILMAEDDPVSRLLLQSTLRKWGHEPIVACDGREALDMLNGLDSPALAILDWMMPDLDGPEICRRMRAKTPPSSIYFILLTAKTQREDLLAGFAAGADDYVTKPFNSQELFARVQAGIRVIELQASLSRRAEELENALSRLHQMQQGQKLEALGRMGAGIAHEINTPAQYISDNIRFFQQGWEYVAPILRGAGDDPEIEYFLREIPKAVEESLQGTHKIERIVRAVRDFSHSKGGEKIPIDINQAIETTLEVSTNEWKYVANLETDFDAGLPSPLGLSGEIHQMLLHLIVNAARAIAEKHTSREGKGTLRITTSLSGEFVEIRISDTGVGIPEKYREKVFEPFFTTRGVGQGSGQGLAVAYSVIVQQHQGKVWFESEEGKGTTFFVHFPLHEVDRRIDEGQETHSVCGR
jgi:two-component system, NtrC family, sensor kinase